MRDSENPVPEYPTRLLLDYATKCNLRCPMCLVWGSREQRRIEAVKGVMDRKVAQKLLDEVAEAGPLIQPNLWGEPLLIPMLDKVIRDIKSRQLSLVMNTNGLALTERRAELLLREEVDSVMVSIDAVTPATLLRVRGTDRLERIVEGVHRLLRMRGDRPLPRIGISFTVQEANEAELSAFIEKWTPIADVVRVGHLYEESTGRFSALSTGHPRQPCPSLYSTLAVHNDGTARLCCLDALRATDMGNVFEEGVKAVWHGEAFSRARHFHETAQWNKIPLCEKCNGWAVYDYGEEVAGDLLIRRSPQFIYYNRIARLKNWHGRILGGHSPPPRTMTQG